MHRLLAALLLSPLLAQAEAAEVRVTDQVYFDISIGGEDAGRIVFGLFGEVAPRTVRNFVSLATEGVGGKTYRGSPFHRVIRKFMVQGGDVVHGDGSGSVSIYGDHFEDESFDIPHNAPGILSMANAGRDSCGCQFFITTIATPWLDGKHTAFGKVIDGQDVVHKIELQKTDSGDRPLQPVVVRDCGALPTPEPFYISHKFMWMWVRSSFVPLSFSISILAFFQYMLRKLDN
ncbi:peptidyl-prolyl cis-trans isomerase 6 [Thrips palmi]|uniref:Peptidyl-prolyl cis-trans isomerase n=1 Tax=Thrips palmi TaxID=161013 RepID=A0A6P9A425_THRPL|nr:peptidyl-prolyl cis-trans isomerase 6 [Thrips palmi]